MEMLERMLVGGKAHGETPFQVWGVELNDKK